MTAQISDTFRYREKPHALAGVNGTGLFEPSQQGIKAVGWSTACWRGFHCAYEVADGALFLTQVNLGLGEEDMASAARGEGPKLFGKVPRPYTIHGHSTSLRTGRVETSWESPDFVVDGLREAVPFTGGLLLGDDFIRELYVHMGFHPAYKFRVVHELVFDAGRLTEEHDRSAQMAEFRERLSPRSLEPGRQASRAEVEAWVKRCFSLEYKGFRASAPDDPRAVADPVRVFDSGTHRSPARGGLLSGVVSRRGPRMPRRYGTTRGRVAAAAVGGLVGAGLMGGIGYTHGSNIAVGAVAGAPLVGGLAFGVASGIMSPVTLCAVLFALFFCMIGPGCDDYGGNAAVPAAIFGAFIGWLFFGRRRRVTSQGAVPDESP
jgi:hypothetical protein